MLWFLQQTLKMKNKMQKSIAKIQREIKVEFKVYSTNIKGGIKVVTDEYKQMRWKEDK